MLIRTEACAYLDLLSELDTILQIMAIKYYVTVTESAVTYKGDVNGINQNCTEFSATDARFCVLNSGKVERKKVMDRSRQVTSSTLRATLGTHNTMCS